MADDALVIVIKVDQDGLASRARAVRDAKWSPQPDRKFLGMEPHAASNSQIPTRLTAPISRKEDGTTNSGTFEPSALRSEA